MNYLLDTHTFLWSLISPDKISSRARKIIVSRKASLHISTISLWEASLKYSIGKIDIGGVLPKELPYYAKRSGLKIISINSKIASSYYKLPKLRYHKDPFDRMLIWQAIRGGYTLISKDKSFSGYEKYGLSLVW